MTYRSTFGTGAQIDAALVNANSAVQPGDAATDLNGTAHRLFYTNGTGDVTELAFGANGTVLTSTGAATAPAFEANPYVTPQQYGAVGDGVADDTAAIQAAIGAAEAAGRAVVLPPGVYLITATLLVTASIMAQVGARLVVSGNRNAIQVPGTRVTGEANTLASNASIGATTIALSAGKGANFSVGEVALVMSEAVIRTQSPQKYGELRTVTGISGDTLTIDAPLTFAFNTADSAQVQRLETVDDIQISGLDVSAAVSSANTTGLCGFFYARRLRLENCTFSNCHASAMVFFGCVGHEVISCRVRDLASSDSVPYYGYGVEEAGANGGGRIVSLHAERVRHAYTTNRATTTLPYGEPVGTRISAGSAVACPAAAWDTHAEGAAIVFDNCAVVGCGRSGFQIRSRDTSVIGGSVRGAVGAAVWLATFSNALAQDCSVIGLISSWTNLGVDDTAVDWREFGAVRDMGIRNVVSDSIIKGCGGPAIEAESTSWRDGVYRNNRAIEPCSVTTTKRWAAGYTGTASTTLVIDGLQVLSTHSNMQNAVNIPSTNVHARVLGVDQTGATASPVSVNNSHYSAMNPAQGAMLSNGPAVDVTIAAGVLTLPSSRRGYGRVKVSGEGGGADDLDSVTATGFSDGQLIVLSRGTGTITIKHGIGNIVTGPGTDIVMDSVRHRVTLERQSPDWVVLSRNY